MYLYVCILLCVCAPVYIAIIMPLCVFLSEYILYGCNEFIMCVLTPDVESVGKCLHFLELYNIPSFCSLR